MDGWGREGHQASTQKQIMHTEELLIGCVIQSIRISSFLLVTQFFQISLPISWKNAVFCIQYVSECASI